MIHHFVREATAEHTSRAKQGNGEDKVKVVSRQSDSRAVWSPIEKKTRRKKTKQRKNYRFTHRWVCKQITPGLSRNRYRVSPALLDRAPASPLQGSNRWSK